jgi:hypothetical protein
MKDSIETDKEIKELELNSLARKESEEKEVEGQDAVSSLPPLSISPVASSPLRSPTRQRSTLQLLRESFGSTPDLKRSPLKTVYSIDENDYQRRMNRDDESDEGTLSEDEDKRRRTPESGQRKNKRRDPPKASERLVSREKRKERVLQLLDELKALIEDD